MNNNLPKILFSLFCILEYTLNANADVNYLIDSNREYPVVMSEYDENNVTLATYTYGNDPVPLSRHDAITNETHFYHYDGNFNLTNISDSTGKIIASYTYDAFGKILNKTGSNSNKDPAFFAGHMIEPNAQNYNMRARYYNPNIGRFTQQDSFQGKQGIPQSLHKYNYAHNNPVNNRDPSGKFIGNLGAVNTIGAILATSTLTVYSAGLTSRSSGRDSASLASSSIQLMSSVRNGLNEIFYFNTKHTKNVINGLLQDADEHADKIGGSPPEDPNKSHWKKEVRAFLNRAKKLADKRLKGNTRINTLQKIEDIAKRAGVELL